MCNTGLQNLRDVGGIPVAGGGRIRSGVLYRSDAPRAGDAAGALAPWPPRTVVDLRSAREQGTGHVLEVDRTTIHRAPLSADLSVANMAEGSVLPAGGLPGFYRHTLATVGEVIAEVAAVVAEAPAPVLVHCAAGKDRTGIVVAAILDAVGVSRAEIVADSCATGPNMDGVVARMVAAEATEADVFARLLERHPEVFTAPEEAIGTALDVFAQAGGGAAWLQTQGLSADALTQLRERLVQPC